MGTGEQKEKDERSGEERRRREFQSRRREREERGRILYVGLGLKGTVYVGMSSTQ